MSKFHKLTAEEARELGAGNRAGYDDYTKAIHPRFAKDDLADPSPHSILWVRGYMAGYRKASLGKPRPFWW
jgi:hypothetical protein